MTLNFHLKTDLFRFFIAILLKITNKTRIHNVQSQRATHMPQPSDFQQINETL